MIDRPWIAEAVRRIEADYQRSADTHLIPLALPAFPGVHLYLKDESSHPTGSLKHRLARSLFLYALCNGWLREGGPVIESSSGSTAVSEAYFARLLGLPFIAVMPATTSPEKVAAIRFYGGECHLVQDPQAVASESERLAREQGGHYMDQFTYAERATDWRSNNNIAESLFGQMAREPHPVPAWVVCSAGTGGTTATMGRYVRYRRLATRVCLADPENSVFFDAFSTRDASLRIASASLIEGIGRPRVEKSFLPSILDAAVQVPDALSIGAIRWLERTLGRRCGGSTGTNLVASMLLASRMHAAGEAGSIVTVLCDGGERYRHSFYDDAWVASKGIDLAPAALAIEAWAVQGAPPAFPVRTAGL